MRTAVAVRADAVMGTVVTIDVRSEGAGDAVDRALGWFHHVETCCSRFDEDSELMRLSARVGIPVAVSDVLFEAVRFALLPMELDGVRHASRQARARGTRAPSVGRRRGLVRDAG